MDNRPRRAAIAQEILAILEQGSYRNRRSETVTLADDLAAAIAGSIHYRVDQLRDFAAASIKGLSFATEIEVSEKPRLAAMGD